jgi:hypothetical protein
VCLGRGLDAAHVALELGTRLLGFLERRIRALEVVRVAQRDGAVRGRVLRIEMLCAVCMRWYRSATNSRPSTSPSQINGTPTSAAMPSARNVSSSFGSWTKRLS